jgi:hypothetical protein
LAIFDVYTLGGLAGTAILIAAYFANQIGRLPSDDWRFPFANLVGACLILASLMIEWNLPSVIIEAFWIAISLYGIARQARRRQGY